MQLGQSIVRGAGADADANDEAEEASAETGLAAELELACADIARSLAGTATSRSEIAMALGREDCAPRIVAGAINRV